MTVRNYQKTSVHKILLGTFQSRLKEGYSYDCASLKFLVLLLEQIFKNVLV